MENPTQEPAKPTRDEIIAWFKDQIEVAELRARLSELQSKAAQEDAKRIQATILIAQMQAPTPEETEAPEENPQEKGPITRTLKREK